MEIEFDPAKDAYNMKKHKLSLARAADLDIKSVQPDDRFTHERRFQAFGLLDGLPHCLAYKERGTTIRAISFRRAHLKEYRRRVR